MKGRSDLAFEIRHLKIDFRFDLKFRISNWKSVFSSNMNRNELLSLISRFSAQRVVLLGDLVADEFVYGEITRVSREAPVLILKEQERHIVPGGGANAANNLADLGAQVDIVGAVGDDESGEALVRYFQQKSVSTRHVLRVRGYRTPTKSRILGGLSHWQRQQIVRVDRQPEAPFSPEIRRRVTEGARPLLENASALLVSDYGFGATNHTEIERLLNKSKAQALLTTIDSRYELLSYTNFTAATPNEPEVEVAFGARIGNNTELLHELGAKMLRRQKLKALLVTRGREGMVLFQPRAKPEHIPIFGTDEAVDVTGAGDTVIAAFTLALATGASFLNAAEIANCAGGLVVMKRGTATVTRRELEEAIRNS